MTNVPMLKAVDLTKHYEATNSGTKAITKALNGVSFEVGANEVVGLLGPNGAGKTTLMKILTGYLQPTAGTAHVGGVDVVDDPLTVQAKIGYLPENAPLYPDMLVQEYLQMMASLRQLGEDQKPKLISEAVRRTGLQDFLIKPIGKLSKGYRQRVGLAQAILHRPQVLILDEPTNGLDPTQIVEIRQLIQDLAKNATVLLSTHILSEVELTCQRVLIITEGLVRADAKLSELQAAHAALVSIDSSATDVVTKLQAIPGVTTVTSDVTINGFTKYRVAGETQDLCPTIFDVARTAGWRLAELRADQQNLESIFRSLVGQQTVAQQTIAQQNSSGGVQ